MKLLYPFLFAMCRMSSGLKVNVATRSLCNRVSDALGQASLSIPIVSRKAISAAIIGTFVAFNPMTNSLPAYAANLEASQLFAKAESAIEDNLKDFKILEQDWSTAKKVITENGNLLSKATSSLTTLKTKMTEYDATLVKMLEEDVASNAQIEAEIVLLRESTGTKYAAAEAASAIPAKPSVTAQLFLKAQNEASTLAQDEKTLKSFSETIIVDSSLKKRADEILAGLIETVAKAAEIQAIQSAGLADMVDGLASNAKACKDSLNACSESGAVGLTKFRDGIKTVDSAEEKFTNLKKDVVSYLRELESVSADLEKSSLKFNEILLDDSAWEEETKLRLKDSKNAVKLTAQKYEKSLKSTTEMIEKIAGTSEILANKNSNNRKEVADVLKAVSAKLEIADRSGKSAEKLLKQAKAQGDKESAKYLKFLPAAVPAAPSTPVLAKA